MIPFSFKRIDWVLHETIKNTKIPITKYFLLTCIPLIYHYFCFKNVGAYSLKQVPMSPYPQKWVFTTLLSAIWCHFTWKSFTTPCFILIKRIYYLYYFKIFREHFFGELVPTIIMSTCIWFQVKNFIINYTRMHKWLYIVTKYSCLSWEMFKLSSIYMHITIIIYHEFRFCRSMISKTSNFFLFSFRRKIHFLSRLIELTPFDFF